jgi:hypothetical protein
MPKTSEEIREGYRQRLILPEFPSEGKPIRFLTSSETEVAQGYERVVIGDRGPYIEFSDNHIVWMSLHIPKDQSWRVAGRCYYIEYRTDDKSNVKVYKQKAVVGYADYKVDMLYISPFDLVTEQYPMLIKLIIRERL